MTPRIRQRKTGALTRGASERLTALGIWTWLAMLEDESDQLTPQGRAALGALREDLERLAEPEQ